MTHTLLPCPRCGGAAVHDEPYPGDYTTGGIHCDDCGYWTGDDMGRQEAIKWWNSRPLVDRLQARIAELETKLNEAKQRAFVGESWANDDSHWEFAHAPAPEEEPPDPPDDWDEDNDEDKPHYEEADRMLAIVQRPAAEAGANESKEA